MSFILLTSDPGHAQVRNNRKNPVVGKVAGEEVRLDEIKRFYASNYPADSLDAGSLREFLPSYLLYKAKVAEAMALSVDTTESYMKELREFGMSAAPSFWIENDMKNRLLNEFVERSEVELKASHVLVRLTGNATMTEVQRAYDTLMKAREDYAAGATMEELNETYSTRIQGRPIGGDIPWFSAGTTVYDFENAVYALQPGEISMPVRTEFGYHLILLEQSRPRSVRRSVSHIFFRDPDEASLKARVDSAVADLQAGRTWEEVVMQYTADMMSRESGGSIGWVSHDLRFDEAFTDSVLALDPTAPWSGPVATTYGTHLFRVDSVEVHPSEEARREALFSQLRQTPRYDLKEEDVIRRIIQSPFVTIRQEMVRRSDDLILGSGAPDMGSISVEEMSESLLGEELLSVNGVSWTVRDYLLWIGGTFAASPPSEHRSDSFDRFAAEKVRDQLVEITAASHPEFRQSLDQFRNGLLVFRMNELNVWDPAYADTLELKRQFEANTDAYVYLPRYVYTLFSSRADSLLEEARQGLIDGLSTDSLKSLHPSLSFLTDSTESVSVEPWDQLADLEPGAFTPAFRYRNRPAMMRLDDILPSRPMTFEEAFFRVFSDMQPMLEERFNERLRLQYGIRAYPERIR